MRLHITTPGTWLVLFALIVATAGLEACTPWPGLATGGLAERHQSDWRALLDLEARYDAVQLAGADRFAAGAMVEARLLLTRAQREYEGGLLEDSNHTLTQADSLIASIEHDMTKKRASLRGPARN